jgi:hypothetical protein
MIISVAYATEPLKKCPGKRVAAGKVTRHQNFICA